MINFKKNKFFIVLIFILNIGILVGCVDTSEKMPNGIENEYFYKDMQEVINVIVDDIKEGKVSNKVESESDIGDNVFINKINNYIEDKNLNEAEQTIAMYAFSSLYYLSLYEGENGIEDGIINTNLKYGQDLFDSLDGLCEKLEIANPLQK